MTPNSDPRPKPRRRMAALALAVAALAALPYLVGGVSPNFIILDDNYYIYENPQVRQGLSPGTALWALTTTEHANWYPLRRLSHLVDVSLFGMDARRHHLVSVGWHAAAAVLLFAALRLMTGATWRSFVVAGFFAAHPLQVESVAWAAERSNVLAGFFFALTLLLWVRHARRPGPGRYGAVLLGCALGLMAKPVLVTLPFLLLLLDYWPLGRMSWPGAPPWRVAAPLFGRRLLEKAPLILLAAAAGAMAVLAHRQAKALETLEAAPLGERLANAAISYWRYVGKLLVPVDLAVPYPIAAAPPPAAAALAAALLAALSGLALLLARRKPWLATGWLWFAGMLLPMIGIVQFGAQSVADRFVYLPAIGFFLALVWFAAEQLPTPLRRPAVLGPLAGAALAALAAGTAVQTCFWRDSETLLLRALAVTKDNWLAHNNFATVLMKQGRHAEAIDHLQEVVRIAPGYRAEALNNMGKALFESGRQEESVLRYRQAIGLRRDYPDAQHNLGLALEALGRQAEAEAAYREAIRLSADFSAAHTGLGLLLASQGRRAEAEACYREAIRTGPGFAAAHTNLGVLLAREGRFGEAEASFREAARISPDLIEPLVNLGFTLTSQGRHAEAETVYREVLRRAPNSYPGLAGLGRALAAQGRRDEAAARYREALRLNPDAGETRRDLEALGVR
jgi:tetratricopeptide (TPR) repeat protein